MKKANIYSIYLKYKVLDDDLLKKIWKMADLEGFVTLQA